MRIQHKKSLIAIIGVFLIALIISTASNTVAAGDWGDLKDGDVTRWRVYLNPEEGTEYRDRYTVEVLQISGDFLTYRWEKERINGSILIDQTSGVRTDEVWTLYGYIYSQGYLKEMKDNELMSYKQHSWNGINYRTYYYSFTIGGKFHEQWIDQGAGILLEIQYTTGGGTFTSAELVYTDAKMNEVRGYCFGTMLITFVSVATFVSYSLVRFRKKKKP